jgi:hypothetical protein
VGALAFSLGLTVVSRSPIAFFSNRAKSGYGPGEQADEWTAELRVEAGAIVSLNPLT